jgi:Secretion system C-terminal sorting domain
MSVQVIQRMAQIFPQIQIQQTILMDINSTSPCGLEHMSIVFGNNIQVRVNSDKKQTISLQLFNEQGKLVRTKEINGEAGINYVQLENTGQLSAGAYFLQLSQEGEKVVRKIIKQ